MAITGWLPAEIGAEFTQWDPNINMRHFTIEAGVKLDSQLHMIKLYFRVSERL